MKKISNYNDLVSERNQLEQKLVIHKANLKTDFANLKDSLRPMSLIKDMIGIENKNGIVGPLAGAGLNAGIDMVVKNNVLAKAGFVVRSLIPFALKSIVNFFSKNSRHNELVEKKS